jgi:methylated-DNA-[protein]-cysteine S-methyltransferase
MAQDTIHYLMQLDGPLGPMQLLADETHLTHVYWTPHRHAADLTTQPGEGHPILQQAAGQLTDYFAGSRTEFTLPLQPKGTEFQQKVWKALSMIPWGETWSYLDLAKAIGSPSSSRAVGAANGRNPISIIIPCHRVIGSSGTLTGYAGGVEKKEWLLHHEGFATLPLFRLPLD